MRAPQKETRDGPGGLAELAAGTHGRLNQPPCLAGRGRHSRARCVPGSRYPALASGPSPLLAEHAHGFVIDFARQEWSSSQGAPFAVLDAGSNVLLGSAGLKDIDFDGKVATGGYWVAPWARGQRVALRAMRLVCEWAYTGLGLDRVEFFVEPSNRGSCSTVEHGRARVARHEGRIRGHCAAPQRAWLGSAEFPAFTQSTGENMKKATRLRFDVRSSPNSAGTRAPTTPERRRRRRPRARNSLSAHRH